MSQSLFRGPVACGLLFVFVSLFCIATAPADDSAPMNLLIIQTDEHHFKTLGCYGDTVVGTPAIDWLAENGALCTSFYATTPVCSPSRGAFVSGRYPQNTPVVTNNIPLDDDIISFAEVLRREGYATGYAGKWHLDGGGKPQWGPVRQFGFEDNRFMFNRGHWKKFEDTEEGPRVGARSANGTPNYNVDDADETSFATDWLAIKTIEFIDEHQDEPFCYMVSFPDPHGPNTVRAPYDTMYADVEVEIPSTITRTPDQIPAWGQGQGANPEQIRKLMPPYYGMVRCIDDNVAMMIEALREKDLLDNTVIVFTADHGDLCGEHQRLNKGVPYEGSAKIPFILYQPGKVEGGLVIDEALSCVDFFPTITSLLEIEHDVAVEGRDASPLFFGEMPDDWNDIAFIRATSGGTWLAAVTDDYKLVFSKEDTPWLFDLSIDPEELTNRVDDPAYAEIVQEMTAQLKEYCETYGDNRLQIPEIAEAMAAILAE
jgi:arylsulfatase A-like enzyme